MRTRARGGRSRPASESCGAREGLLHGSSMPAPLPQRHGRRTKVSLRPRPRCRKGAPERSTGHRRQEMRRTPIISALIALVAMTAVLAPAALASGGGTTRSIALHGSVSFPNATGKAVYKVNGSERELQIEVEHIRALAGKRINVFVNGNKLASPLVNSFGVARVNRNTDRGQFVPTIKIGSTVRVRTLGGTLIASGTF